MTLLEAYANFGPDTMANAEGLDIEEHEVDSLINMKMKRDRLGPTVCQMATLNTPRRAIRDCEQPATSRVAPSCLFCESPPALLMSADNSPLAIAASFSTFDHGCTGTGLVSDDEEGRCGFAPAFFVVW